MLYENNRSDTYQHSIKTKRFSLIITQTYFTIDLLKNQVLTT